jgi:hypothetical protein
VKAWWLLACGWAEPGAGELREDVAGLAERVQLPPSATGVRWLTLPGDGERRREGRADARIFAWVATPGGAAEWLTETLGAPLGPRAHWVADNIASTLLSPGELSQLQHHDARGSWKLACTRYTAAGLGRGDYAAGVVLDCGDHLYLTLLAH